MKLTDLVGAMERIAPTRFAESWDNVGLLLGDPQQPIARVMLTIDLTRPVFEEAVEALCDVVIAYHPPIFDPLKRLIGGSLVYDVIRRGMAVYSPHTALDVAAGGTNDVLADALFLENRRPLRPTVGRPTHAKLVTFVPRDAVEKVAAAIFAAGAGIIGDYACCSFRSEGTGTFLGNEHTNPAVGEAGKLERADETRIETLLTLDRIEPVLAALREAHPYEVPAYDLLTLTPESGGAGIGRIGEFAEPVERSVLVARIKRELMIDHVLVSGPADGEVMKVACAAGAGRSLLDDAIAQGVELFVTGELPHHDALRAARAGTTVVATLHSNSERRALTRLSEMLQQQLPKLAVQVSRKDRDPFEVR